MYDQSNPEVFSSGLECEHAAVETMHAIRVHECGGPETMCYDSKVPVPECGATDVIVDIKYAGVNFIDTYHRTGLYQLDLPCILGREGSGVVSQIGADVKDIKVGDRVTFFAQGSYAEKIVVPSSKCTILPDGIDFQTAAAVMLQGLTAHYLTHSTYPIQEGDTVLVQAGAGGTGQLIIQMAKLRGATVITTVSTEEKAKIATEAGADHVIIYTETDFYEEVMQITDEKKVRAVFDGVGKSTWEKSMMCLARRGYLVLFGNASGPVPALDPLLLSKNGSLFVTRPTLKDYVADPAEKASRVKDIFDWIQAGKLNVAIAKEFQLSEATQAHEFLHSRKAMGKILLKVDESL